MERLHQLPASLPAHMEVEHRPRNGQFSECPNRWFSNDWTSTKREWSCALHVSHRIPPVPQQHSTCGYAAGTHGAGTRAVADAEALDTEALDAWALASAWAEQRHK